MAIYDLLTKFSYIEPNNLKGLQPGFVVAQMNVKDETLLETGTRYFANGAICEIKADGIHKATADTKVPFIHYSEPLNTIFSGDELFAVNVDEECPRLVQLIPGDEWMSSRELSEAELLGGRIVKMTGTDGWYGVTTMANGDAGHHYMFLG